MTGSVTGFLLVGVGGSVGALARHAVGERVETRTRDTLAVNLVGSFALGAVLALPAGEPVVLAAGTGFCGAFTTFSSFAFETVQLCEDGHWRRAFVNASGTLAGALLAALSGAVLVTGAL